MATTVTTDFLHSFDGKVAKVQQIAGAWQTISTKTDFDNFTTNATTKQNLAAGTFYYVLDEDQLYKAKVTGVGPFAAWSLDSASFSGIDTSSFITTEQTSSFVLISSTSSMSVATASFISDTFISASAVRSGFGAGGSSIPSGTVSGSQQITDLGFVSSSVDTSLFVLVSETGSFLTAEDTGSFLTSTDTSSFVLISDTSSMSVATASFISDTFISASAVRSGFGTGGGSSTDISSLNTFTGSIQTEVTTLTAATSSYLTSADTSSFVLISSTSSMSVATASYIDPTFISSSAAASGFGAGGSTQSLQDMLDASGNQQLDLSGSLNLNQPTGAGLNYNEVRAGSISALNGGGFWGEISDINSNRTVLNIGISADDDNFVQTKLYSGEGYNTSDPRGIITRLYPHDYVTANSQSKYVEATAKGSTGADSFREYFQVDINTSQAKYLSPLTASNGFVADEIKISSIDSANTNTDKFLVIDSDGLIEYMSGSQLSDSIGALTSLPANIVSSSTQITDLGFVSSSDISSLNTFTSSIQAEVNSLTNATSSYLTSLPSGTISSSAQISALGYLTSETDSQTLSIAGDQLTISNGNTITIPTGSDEATDISQLNVFSGSVQAEVDALTQATASYVDNTDTLFVSQSQPTAAAGGLYFDGNDFYLGV